MKFLMNYNSINFYYVVFTFISNKINPRHNIILIMINYFNDYFILGYRISNLRKKV